MFAIGGNALWKAVFVAAVTAQDFQPDRQGRFVAGDQLGNHLFQVRTMIAGITVGDADGLCIRVLAFIFAV